MSFSSLPSELLCHMIRPVSPTTQLTCNSLTVRVGFLHSFLLLSHSMTGAARSHLYTHLLMLSAAEVQEAVLSFQRLK